MTSLDKNLAKSKRFAFSSSAHAADKFSVVTMSGFEAISKNFSFDLILVSDDDKIDFADMLSNPAKFEIFSPDGKSSTPYHGVLSEFEQLHQAGLHVFYRAVLAPKMHRLEQYRTSEVYLNDQTIPHILETVLKHGGLKPGDFEKKVRGTYRQRSFVCQYQETDFAFVTRWMEKEGIYYYFDHSGQAEKLVFIDESSAQPAEVLNLSYRPEESLSSGPANDSVQSFVCRQKPLPKQVIVQGFNYLDAKAHTLKETAQVSGSGIGDVMIYGENFLDSKEGERYAKLRAQEIACGGKVFLGAATAVGLRSAYFMQLAGHYRSDMNGKYLVTEIEHEGSQAGVLLAGIAHSFGGTSGETSYSCRFRAIASDVQFRPERLAIRPHVAGSMSGIVDSEGDGKYAEMDELGQYKVQLPFSTTGKGANKGSARIRMATPYSGHGYGMHFPLHKGVEVLLSFIDGDPDQPVIMNAAPNSENLSVVNNKNASVDMLKTAGGNSLVFEDKHKEERASLYSPKYNTGWRIGAATDAEEHKDVAGKRSQWGADKHGIHGNTDASFGVDVKDAVVVKVGDKTNMPLFRPAEAQVQILAGSGLINIDNTQVLAIGKDNTKPTETGTLDIYAGHINMYAEPVKGDDGVLTKYKYMLLTSTTKDSDVDSPWGFKQLYELQKFDESTDLKKLQASNGTKDVTASNKTSYTKGDSNSATFGDSASVTHGNSYKLTRGKDFSHSYGLSNSVYFGMKNDLFVGAKSSLSVAAAASLSLGGELKTSIAGTMELSLGLKGGIAVAVDTTIKATSIKAAGVKLKTEVTELKSKVTELKNSVSDIITSSTNIDFSGLHIVL
jgi:type VI secretion system VgrG family protein